MNGELPKGWVWTSLGEIAFKLRSGGTPLKKMNEYYENGTIPFVKIEDISTSGKYLYNTLTTITEEGLNNSSAWVVPKDSLLYSMYASYGIPIINKIEVTTNQAIIAFIPLKDIIELDYVYYYLLFVKSSLKSKIRGTTQENLNAKIVSNIEVPLPPLAEQQRIVNKIEELFTNLDKGVESLNEVKYKLKIYRQAILKYAMEGKLTAKWREEKNYPSVSVQFNLNSDDHYFSKEIANTNIHSSWKLLKVEEIADFFKGQRSPKNYYVDKSHPEAKPYIRIQDFKTKKVSMYTKADWCLQCQKTDTLLATDGAIGSSDYGWEGVLTHHILCIRPKTEFVNPYYLFLFINLNKNFFYENRTGVCSPTLRQQYVKNLAMPLPPLEEQNMIVERIEQLFSLADYIEETVDSKLEQSKTLRQSILKKAFEGKLVPQDPNDEPAEILLEKIKKQRLNKGKLVQEKLI